MHFHQFLGYRIDLNKASQQSTLRLPNGKVIHVRKQAPLSTDRNNSVRYSITSEVPASSVQPLPPQPIINQHRPGPRSQAAIRPGLRQVQRHILPTPQTNMAPRMPPNSVRPTALTRSAPINIAGARPPPPLIIVMLIFNLCLNHSNN